MLDAVSTALPPTALDFRLGVSLETLGAPQIKSWGNTRAALRFRQPRGHIILKDTGLEGNPGFNPTVPLTCCGILTKSINIQPQHPHLCNGEKKAHFIWVIRKSYGMMPEVPIAHSKHSVKIISSLFPAIHCLGLGALHPVFWEGMLTKPARQDSQQPVLIGTI